MKKIFLSIVAVLAISIAGSTLGFAAELPSYEVKGLPISPVQMGLLGAANIRQSQTAVSAPSPQQASVLTQGRKLNTATAARTTTGVSR